MYDFGDIDREVFRRAERGFAWTAYTTARTSPGAGTQPDHRPRWVACTAIVARADRSAPSSPTPRSATSPSTRRSRRARPCSARSSDGRSSPAGPPSRGGPATAEPQHPLVRAATRLLANDPTLSCAALAAELHVSTTDARADLQAAGAHVDRRSPQRAPARPVPGVASTPAAATSSRPRSAPLRQATRSSTACSAPPSARRPGVPVGSAARRDHAALSDGAQDRDRLAHEPGSSVPSGRMRVGLAPARSGHA
jgi:hypothetical protein